MTKAGFAIGLRAEISALDEDAIAPKENSGLVATRRDAGEDVVAPAAESITVLARVRGPCDPMPSPGDCSARIFVR
jgi:hypothetical protein